jgi:hypothetical protein
MSFTARLLMSFAVRHIEVFFEVRKKVGDFSNRVDVAG